MKPSKSHVLSDDDEAVAVPLADPETKILRERLQQLEKEKAQMQADKEKAEAVEKARQDTKDDMLKMFMTQQENQLKRIADADNARIELQADTLNRAREAETRSSNMAYTFMMAGVGIQGTYVVTCNSYLVCITVQGRAWRTYKKVPRSSVREQAVSWLLIQPPLPHSIGRSDTWMTSQ